MLKALCCLLLMMLSHVEAKTCRLLCLESPSYIGGGGMFHNFNIVLGCLDLYDEHDHLGFTVDFKTSGLYYEASYGPNWWNYYFEPIAYPPRGECRSTVLMKYLKDEEKGEIGNAAHFYMQRDRAYELITKYIHVRQEILEEVERFYNQHFLAQQFMIGVHYRGTDKEIEASRTSYETVIAEIQKYTGEKCYKIFVATDEPSFLVKMEEAFPNRVCCIEAQRFQDRPVHYASSQCFLKGKEALIDCLLLAKSHLLIRTNSNLSAVAAYFNPVMPVITLNTMNDTLYEGVSRKGILNELNRR